MPDDSFDWDDFLGTSSSEKNESTEATTSDLDSEFREMLGARTPDDIINDEILPDNDEDVIRRIEKSEKEIEAEKIAEAEAELEKIAEEKAVKDAEIDEIAKAIHELRVKLQEKHSELDELKLKEWPYKQEIREHNQVIRNIEAAEAREAAAKRHLEEEKRREEEILSRKQIAMAGFKNTIDEINPAWKDYAFDHQWEGASSLALHEGGLLADDMGLGKSLTSIMFADMIKAKRILIVTPAQTATNFLLEWGMWAQHRFAWSIAGYAKAARHGFIDGILKPRALAGEDYTLVVNYEQFYSDLEFLHKLHSLKFDLIIVDEFHNAKEKNSLLFKKLLTFRHAGTSRFLPVTGTFILNSPKDIWTALHLVDPEAFPTERRFMDSYCEYNYGTNRWGFRAGGERAMLIALGGRIVKRTMEEAGIVLPKQTIREVPLAFGAVEYEPQKKILKQLAEHSQIILDANTKMNIAAQIALITRQRQGVVWPAGIELKDPETGVVVFSVKDFVENSIKVDWTYNKAMELMAQGKRITVFSQFKTGLAELERLLTDAGKSVVRYDGDTPNDIRSRVKRDFDRRHVEKNNGEYEWDIALCNFKVGGVGLNFTHATEMILLDEEWNPGKNEQAYKRQKRIGQTEETNVWIPRVEGTIDTWMHQINEEKRRMIEGFEAEVDIAKEFNQFLAVFKDAA